MSTVDRTVHVLGVPLDHGAGRRGVSMGPSALRIANLHGALKRVRCQILDRGDIHISIPETQDPGRESARYLPVVAAVCEDLASQVENILELGGFPLVIGGDHSIAIGTISGVATFMRKRGAAGEGAGEVGVLWFDAHGDLNTPDTSPSGNIHGMPLACLLGRGPEELTAIGFPGAKVAPSRVVQIGLRSIDDQEKALLRESGIHAYTMADIDKQGIDGVVEEALDLLRDVDFLHVSFDIDVLDPLYAPGTGTARIGGITYREAHLAMEIVAPSPLLRSFELVEVNPILDERNRTAELAVELIASALGKTIL